VPMVSANAIARANNETLVATRLLCQSIMHTLYTHEMWQVVIATDHGSSVVGSWDH
jgi:hypothetical protein